MPPPEDHRDLGMHRPIARRDFLQGAALTLTSLAPSATPPTTQPDPYPPLRQGLRGNYPASIQHFDAIANARYATFPLPDPAITESYDLVIVGAGISGLSAAHFYRQGLGTDTRILILDNQDDFGGHAKRNEFQYAGKTYIGFGGTMGIATPYPYSYAAKALIHELGIEVERNPEFLNHDLERKYGLTAATFFDKEHFGEDRLVQGTPRTPGFFDQAPLSAAARRDLIRLHAKNPDYLAGLTPIQKKEKLAKISYQDYLLTHAKISPDAIPFFLGNGGRNNKRVDTTPALEAAERGSPGFNGLGIKFEEQFSEASYLFHFPDGNASVARLLLGKLIPDALPPSQTMNTIVQAAPDYTRLDTPNANLRLRLGSSVVRVQNESQSVKIAYIQDGKLKAIRARHCILACYNSLIPGLLPELPPSQRQALAYPAKVPMMYTNVLIKNWQAFQKLGISRISSPGMYHTSSNLDPGSTIGGYRGVSTPDEPILIHLTRNPNQPGLPRKDQNRIGQHELLSTTFEQFELQIRRQLARMLSPAGFDPATHIAAITVNRWPFGYAYTYDSLADPDLPPEQRPHILGRQRFGRITIANSDAGAAAFTNQAIDEANRAVQELFLLEGLT